MKSENTYYSQQDNERWARLIQKLQPAIKEVCKEFQNGLKTIALPLDHIPSFSEVNEKITSVSGWRYKHSPGKMSMRDFLVALNDKIFYAEQDIRVEEEFDFCKLPDIFHDIYGHAALLVNLPFCDFLEGLGRLAVQFSDNEEAINSIASTYWYTAEVGLIYEADDLRFYGGSIISSLSEIDTVKKPTTKIRPYNLKEVMNTSYNSYDVNDQYFYIYKLSELNSFVPEIEFSLQSQLKHSLSR